MATRYTRLFVSSWKNVLIAGLAETDECRRSGRISQVFAYGTSEFGNASAEFCSDGALGSRRMAQGEKLKSGPKAARLRTIMTSAKRYMPMVNPIITCIPKTNTSQASRVFFSQMKNG